MTENYPLMERFYLRFPYYPGDAVGAAKIYWDNGPNLPYVTDVENLEIAAKWLPVYLNCDYSDRGVVKQLGAKWDKHTEKWYIPVGVPRAHFIKWLTLDVPSKNDTHLVFRCSKGCPWENNRL